MSTSSFTVECWGCRKSETHSPVVGPEADAAKEDMLARGWLRRSFWESNWDKGPWFCSYECAHESYNAKQAEEWWAKKAKEKANQEFYQYCKQTPIPTKYLVAFVIALTIFVLGSFYVR